MILSRLELSRSPSARALNALIDPDDAGRRSDAGHRLVWSAFAGDPDAARSFLWREEGRGVFLVLSQHPPGQSELFARIDSRPFAPDLRPGDRLAFTLCANATRTRKTGKTTASGAEAKDHVDIVMHALHPLPRDERAARRMEIAQQVGADWLAGQGARAGFSVEQVTVTDYTVHQVPRRGPAARFGVLDMTGTLTVTDPGAFLPALVRGFGRAKAFGCGLMLIARA
jgi:CRISPR system Cascade subunit CasE